MWISFNKEKYGEYFESKNKEVSNFFSGKLNFKDIQDLREKKLNEVLQYIINNSKYYSNVLKEYKDVQICLSELHRLPFTTKAILQEQQENVLCANMNDMFIYCETSGTTGKSVPCPRNGIDKIFVNLNWTYGWRKLLDPDKKYIIGISGPTELHGMVDTFSEVFANLGHCVVKMNPFSHKLSFKKSLEVMRDLKINVLCATPTVCLLLAKACKQNGFDINKDFSVHNIFLTGELCSDEMAKSIGRIWGAHAINHPYGSQEAFSISTACEKGHLHLLPHDYIYEIVDYKTGEYIGEVGEGELVITMLEKGAKPLIRFRTGDYVKVEKADNCDFPSYTVKPLGRVKDILTLNNKEVTAFEIEELIIKEIQCCYGYGFVISTINNADFLSVELDMESPDKLTEDMKTRIISNLKDYIGVDSSVSATELGKETTLGANIGWKAARVVDNREAIDDEKKLALELSKKRVIL
jgi:phenylacetate-CoA ligase